MSPKTTLLEPPVECPSEHLPWVRSLIAANGYRGRFGSTVYRYLDADGHRYWCSPSAFPPVTVMLNQASNTASPCVPAKVPPAGLWTEPTP